MATTTAVPSQMVPVPRNFIINKRTIISVYPMELEYTLRTGPIGSPENFTTYTLPAAAKDGYVEIEVEDGKEFIMNWEAEPPHLMAAPKSADVLAQDLVRLWRGSGLGTGRGNYPGISVLDPDRPKGEQIEELRKVQTRFFNDLVDEAHSHFNKGPDGLKHINEQHRVAARWLGLNVPWVVEIRAQRQIKTCPACGEEILAAALRCKHCTTNLVEWYQQPGMNPEEDPVAVAAIARAKAAREPIAPKPQAQVAPPLQPNAPKR